MVGRMNNKKDDHITLTDFIAMQCFNSTLSQVTGCLRFPSKPPDNFREPAQIRCTLNKTRSILEVENLLLIARRGNGRIMILVLGGN